jgi:hypothetical protein
MLKINYETFITNFNSIIYGIGDIHGDIMPLIICLRDCCKVIRKKKGFNFKQDKIDDDLILEMEKEWDDETFQDDLNYEWCGNNSYVVFCGDILDNVRGPIYKKPGEFPFEEARIFKFINSINKQAMAQNGRLFKILGNHDMYNLNGKVKYSYSTFVSEYAKNYKGYKQGALNRLDFFGRGKPGAKLIGEDGAYLFLMINDFIFVHGGISSSLINVDRIQKINSSLMEYIYDDTDDNNTFDTETENDENLLTFSNEYNDGLVLDRYFGFVNGKTEEEMCTTLYNRFQIICRDMKKKNFSCNPDKMKLVIGHCNQNLLTSNNNQIFKSGFGRLVNNNLVSQEFTKPVFKGNASKEHGIYGITVSCGDRKDNNTVDFNNPSIFRIDVGMSRGFNLMDDNEDFILSRTPQVLKVDYINSNPETSVIKSTLNNTISHLPKINENPYKRKFIKYKLKYFKLKEEIKNNIK